MAQSSAVRSQDHFLPGLDGPFYCTLCRAGRSPDLPPLTFRNCDPPTPFCSYRPADIFHCQRAGICFFASFLCFVFLSLIYGPSLSASNRFILNGCILLLLILEALICWASVWSDGLPSSSSISPLLSGPSSGSTAAGRIVLVASRALMPYVKPPSHRDRLFQPPRIRCCPSLACHTYKEPLAKSLKEHSQSGPFKRVIFFLNEHH